MLFSPAARIAELRNIRARCEKRLSCFPAVAPQREDTLGFINTLGSRLQYLVKNWNQVPREIRFGNLTGGVYLQGL